MTRASSAWTSGLIAGIAFFIHAWIQNSHAWPLIWPFLGGVLAVILVRSRISLGSALATGAVVGLISALVFVIVTALALYGLGLGPETGEALQAGATLLGVLIIVGLAMVAAAVGAAIAYLLTHNRRTIGG
jgi:hypothetical protein